MEKTAEIDRLKALDGYSILDTMPDSDYDELTVLAASICSTPVALITLVDEDRQWFKSHHGIAIEETPREHSFCAHAIRASTRIFYVRDAREDSRFSSNPLVTGDPYVTFYAGVPLINLEGHALGTLCVIDQVPRDLSEHQLAALEKLANQAMKLLELRKHKYHLKLANDRLERRNRMLERFAQVAASQINSPLQLIRQAAGETMSRWAGKNEDLAQSLRPIQSSAMKLNNLVQGLLASAQHADDNLEKDEITVEELQDELLNLFPSSADRQLEFFFRMRFVRAHHSIRAVFRELVSNAIRHNDKARALIEIGGSEDDKFYDFFVSDNGSGMSNSNLLQAFELFTTLEPTDRYGEYSLGVGLSTVKSQIYELGGMLDIDSEEGEGTIVTFSIPK